ncbi:MAG: insulinase family protein [bacterium]|jgi:Zn-dependent M16 (insulinase) family peptidase
MHSEIPGFIVRKTTPVPALRGMAIELEHEVSGARILHLLTEDTENLFSISFPTPPPDDTGVPHILEHSVLAGSQKFPVREPFFEMLKSSMATFINAMTGPDCTYYPVSSNVEQDLFNLAEVYFDAVFHPLLTEGTFMREGHHLAPANPEEPTGKLTVSGIVYNEMKGVFSSPESLLFYTWLPKLLPDTAYAKNYAGHPDAIPNLTYDQFKQFYAAHYHPANAFFYFYGNIPTASYLSFLAPRLAGITRRAIEPIASRQPRWLTPARFTETYPAAQDEPLEDKTFLSLTWLTGNALDPEQAVLRHVLTTALFGNEAAPLKKALVDSKLGQDILDCGDMDLGPETIFSVGIKGSNPDKANAFEQLVLSSLKSIATDGLPRELIEAAFQQTAYHYLEIMPMFPLHTMNHVLSAWVHGADPLSFLDMSRHLEVCRQRYEADPQVFSRLIMLSLVENTHRLTTVLTPDKSWQNRVDAALAARMESERSHRTEAELLEISQKSAAIDADAGTANSPEKVALLPQLKVKDLPAKPRHIPTALERLQTTDHIPQTSPGGTRNSELKTRDSGVPVLRNDLFTNGVNYLRFSLDLAGLPEDLWSFLPHYCEAITKLGAAGMNYETMARRVSASTGGFACAPSFQSHASITGKPVLTMGFACKALDAQIDKAMQVIHDLIFAVDPRDPNRLRDVLMQTRAGYRSDVMENGHSYAQCHAGRHLTSNGLLAEQCNGIPQAALAARLCDHFEAEVESLMERIERIRSFMLSPERLAISFTGSDHAYNAMTSAFGHWLPTMKGTPLPPTSHTSPLTSHSSHEGLAVPIQVAHCAQGMLAPKLDDPRSAALVIATHLTRFEYFLPEIRLKGNAYGGGISYNPVGGTLFMTSFRDPHITRTLDIFAKTPEFVKTAVWSQADIDRAIIGTAKGDEKPLRPSEVTSEALSRHLQGITPELREAFYAARLAVRPSLARSALLETLEAGFKSAPICVLSSREKLTEANKTLTGNALEISDVVL